MRFKTFAALQCGWRRTWQRRIFGGHYEGCKLSAAFFDPIQQNMNLLHYSLKQSNDYNIQKINFEKFVESNSTTHKLLMKKNQIWRYYNLDVNTLKVWKCSLNLSNSPISTTIRNCDWPIWYTLFLYSLHLKTDLKSIFSSSLKNW